MNFVDPMGMNDEIPMNVLAGFAIDPKIIMQELDRVEIHRAEMSRLLSDEMKVKLVRYYLWHQFNIEKTKEEIKNLQAEKIAYEGRIRDLELSKIELLYNGMTGGIDLLTDAETYSNIYETCKEGEYKEAALIALALPVTWTLGKGAKLVKWSKPGVYFIYNKKLKRAYVGSSIDVANRLKTHDKVSVKDLLAIKGTKVRLYEIKLPGKTKVDDFDEGQINRLKRIFEKEVYLKQTKKFKKYKFLNDEETILSDDKVVETTIELFEKFGGIGKRKRWPKRMTIKHKDDCK